MAGVEVKTKTSVGCYRVSMTRARWNTGSMCPPSALVAIYRISGVHQG